MTRVVALALALLPSLSADGADLAGHGQLGTGGAGLGLSGAFAGDLSWRAELNAMDMRGSRTVDGVDFDYGARFRDVGFLLDWKGGAGVTLTAGAMFTRDTRFHATATGGRLYGIDLDAYNPQPGDLDATVSFRSWSPYLGITVGDRRPAKGRMGLFAEIGLVRSAPRFTFDEPYNPLLIPALVKAKEIEINRDMPTVDGWWPVVKVGASYGF